MGNRRKKVKGLYLRKDSPYYWMTLPGYQPQSTGTADYALAEKVRAKALTLITEGKWFDFKSNFKQKTLIEMIDRYDEEYTANRSYYSRARERSVFKNLYAFFGEHCTMTELEQKIGGYEQSRKSKGIMPGTIVRELGLLRTMFFTAKKQWKWKVENPVSGIQLPKVKNERVRYLSKDEYKRLLETLKTAEPWLQSVVIIALDTGLRLANLCNLRWSEVNIFSKMITIDGELMKNDEYLGIPLTERAFNLLKELHKVQCPSGHVFHENGIKLYDRKIQRAFKEALKMAVIRNFHFHELRHTFASYLRQGGVDLAEIGELLGHKDLRMTKRYAHQNVDQLRGAINALNTLSTTKSLRSEGDDVANIV